MRKSHIKEETLWLYTSNGIMEDNVVHGTNRPEGPPVLVVNIVVHSVCIF